MRKRRVGYAVWLLLIACLYFFENNTGTRAVLICTVLIPLVPVLRIAFFVQDDPIREAARKPQTVNAFVYQEAEEPGDVRLYQPGDPIRWIHWKLSAKKDELLIRETAAEQETVRIEKPAAADDAGQKRPLRKPLVWISEGLIILSLALLLLLPDARHGAQALCNRIFAASEAVNAYAYAYFPVAEGQSVTLASFLIISVFIAVAALAVLLRSRLMALCFMAAVTLFQIYFGLPLPGWANILLYGLLAVWMLKRPVDLKKALLFVAVILAVALLVMLLLPGVDADTEAASETVRDHLSRMVQLLTGTVFELPEGETMARHVYTQSLETGNSEARTDREYRLTTVEEEQISMPHFISWLKMILLFLLAILLVILPFAPFLLLNARKKKAQDARRVFASENVSEAVSAILQYVIVWLCETGHDAGNVLYTDWAGKLPAGLPEGYAARFKACMEDYEEAAYSSHEIPEEKRQMALDLLKETETALLRNATLRQRFRIRYWMCLCE